MSASTAARSIRLQVRDFLRAEIAAGTFEPRCDAWLSGHDPGFSRTLASHGWVGMTFPRAYGGTGGPAVERFVVVEELLAHGAPVAAHWIADRQTGPLLLKYGSEAQRRRFLPAIARGECYFAIGMSEPDTRLGPRLDSHGRYDGRRWLAPARGEDLDQSRPPKPFQHRAVPDLAARRPARTRG